MNEIKYLSQQLMLLTMDFTHQDFIECRKERNWEKLDKLNEAQKMIYRIKEIKEFKNGYFEEEIE